MTQNKPFFTEEDFKCNDNCALHLSPVCAEEYPECFVHRFNFKVAPLLERLEKLESLVRGAVDSWGDYSPVPQSKAGKTLIEMKLYIRGIEINETKT